jgi:hypothetical protein
MGVEFHGNGPLDKCLIDLSLWIVARDVSRGFAPIVREPKGLPQGPFGPPPAVLRTLDPNPWVHESETINLQNINITLTVALVLVSAIRSLFHPKFFLNRVMESLGGLKFWIKLRATWRKVAILRGP